MVPRIAESQGFPKPGERGNHWVGPPVQRTGPGANRHLCGVARRREPDSSPRRRTEPRVQEERTLSCAESISAFIPASDDGWAILSEPPGVRDLGVATHWSRSTERSLRRRTVRRSRFGEVQTARMSLAVATVAFTGGVAAVATGGAGTAMAAPTYSLNL